MKSDTHTKRRENQFENKENKKFKDLQKNT